MVRLTIIYIIFSFSIICLTEGNLRSGILLITILINILDPMVL